jgi:hypothetical protein
MPGFTLLLLRGTSEVRSFMFPTDFIRFCSHVPLGHSHFWGGWSMLCLVVRSITRVLRSRSRRLSVLSVWNNLDTAGLLSIRFISSILTMAIQTTSYSVRNVKNETPIRPQLAKFFVPSCLLPLNRYCRLLRRCRQGAEGRALTVALPWLSEADRLGI